MPSKSTLSNHFHPIDHDSHAEEEEEQPLDHHLDSPEAFFDLPPESFWLPESHEQDWFHRNAMMQRKRSMKFSFTNNNGNYFVNQNPKSFSSRFWRPSVNPNMNPNPNGPLFGALRNQKSCLVDGNFRRNKAGTGIARLFRSRSEPCGKLVFDAVEPGSPRVSCMGKVAMEAGTETNGGKKLGIWRSIKSIFRNRSSVAKTAAAANEGRTGFA